MKTLEYYCTYFEHINEIQAVYLIHIESKKIQSKVISPNHNKSLMLTFIKSISTYIKKGEFEMMYIEEFKDNLFVKNISSEDVVIIISVEKQLAIGSIFNILKKL
jgi:hypothetical protein